MCRPAEQGGRRCPSDTDPIKRAEKNAKRRAKYAANKGKKPASEAKFENHADADGSRGGETIQTKMNKEERLQQQQEFSSGEADYELNRRDPGIQKTPTPESDWALFEANHITGKIDYTTLNEESYKEFGFDAVKPHKRWAQTMDKYSYPYEYGEVDNLKSEEKTALRQYTGNAYSWINQNSFRPHEIPLLSPGKIVKDGAIKKTQTSIEGVFEFEEMVNQNAEHIEMLKKVTDEMDSALTKGPKKQRILYRGATGTEIGDNADEWVAKNRQIGMEVVFDGYNSTSTKKKTANGFSGSVRKSVIYEILTPEGVAVSSLSYHKDESEVVLPRKQRYVVVGNQKDVDGMNIIQMVAVNSKGEILDGTNSDPIEPLVNDELMEKTKNSNHLAAWKSMMSKYIETEYYDGDSGFSSYKRASRDPGMLKKAAKATQTDIIDILNQNGSKDEAAKLKELFKNHPDITPQEALALD